MMHVPTQRGDEIQDIGKTNKINMNFQTILQNNSKYESLYFGDFSV